MQNRANEQPTEPVQAEPFIANPLALLATALAAGIIGNKVISISTRGWIGLSAIFTVLAFIAFLRGNNRITTVAITALALLLGCALAAIEESNLPPDQLRRLLDQNTADAGKVIPAGEPIELTGVLEREPEVATQRIFLNLRVQRVAIRGAEREVSGAVLLLVPAVGKAFKEELNQLDLRYGARLRVMTSLDRSEKFRNPGGSSFTEYLDREGYDATGFVKSPLLIERLENTRVFMPLAWLYQWRRHLQAAFHFNFNGSTAGVLDAALLGNHYNLSQDASERFREGGTFHVLVISGLHITFLGGLVFFVSRHFTKNDAARFSLSVSAVWGYSLAVGAEPSVLRAALMFTLVALAPLLARRASSLNALGGAALALLVWRPSDVFAPSFQLTFVSVMAIVVLAWPLLQRMSEIGAWRPTRETPYPPSAPAWLRTTCEILFWSERKWKRDLTHANYSYHLFKSPLATALDRYHLQRGLRYVFAAVVVSASVQIALLPFLVIYFHRVSPASLVLNIGVSLMMAGIALFGTVALLCAQVSSAMAWPFIVVTNGLNWLMIHSVDPFARMGIASVRLPEYTGWAAVVYGVYYAPLATLVVMLDGWHPLRLPEGKRFELLGLTAGGVKRLALALQALVIVIVVFHPFSSTTTNGKLRIDFLDVGQGDSALVTMPDNTTLLIDGGGKPGPFRSAAREEDEPFERETRSIGETVVSEYLWWRGLDQIDYILATHADADHIDGLNDVVRNFDVRTVLVARSPSLDAEYSKLANTLRARRTPLQLIGAGDVLRFGNVSAAILWPAPSENPRAASRNNDSVVLRLGFRERSILFTGDVESAGENALVKAGTETQMGLKDPLRSDVVKVSHHGSKTSSTEGFVTATAACWAIIPVGLRSRFGHPHADVVKRWQASGATVLTTGERGTITVTTDGRDLQLETYVNVQTQRR